MVTPPTTVASGNEGTVLHFGPLALKVVETHVQFPWNLEDK
jgi:hypothetical protein